MPHHRGHSIAVSCGWVDADSLPVKAAAVMAGRSSLQGGPECLEFRGAINQSLAVKGVGTESKMVDDGACRLGVTVPGGTSRVGPPPSGRPRLLLPMIELGWRRPCSFWWVERAGVVGLMVMVVLLSLKKRIVYSNLANTNSSVQNIVLAPLDL